MGALAITVDAAQPDAVLTRDNAIILELKDGQRIRVWLKQKPRGRVKAVIDAPREVIIRRGTHVGAEADHESARGT